jgi:hypothetical protein
VARGLAAHGRVSQWAVGAALMGTGDPGRDREPGAPGAHPARTLGLGTLNGQLGPLAGQLAAARDDAGGAAGSIQLGTGWGARTLDVQHAWVDRLASPEFSTARDLSGRTRAQLGLGWNPSGRILPRLGLEAQREAFRDGGWNRRLAARIALLGPGSAVSNRIAWERAGGPGGDFRPCCGQFLASRSFRHLALRGALDYQLAPGPAGVRHLTLGADTWRLRPWQLQVQLGAGLGGPERRLGFQLSRPEGRAALRLRAEFDRVGGWSLGAGMRVALGREPRSGRWFASPEPLAGRGAVSAQAFLDPHGQGRRAPGAAPLEGLELAVDGSRRPGLAPGDGTLFYPLGGWGEEVQVVPLPGALEDPYLKPARPGYRIRPRPGRTVLLEVPMVPTGEVTGTVELEAPEGSRPLPGLVLELTGRDGRIHARTASGHDGFFHLGDLPPGDYRLGLAAGEAERLDLPAPPPRALRLSAEAPCVDDLRLRLRPAAAGGRP